MAPLPLVVLDQLHSDAAQVPGADAHELGARQQVHLVAVVTQVQHLVHAVQRSSETPRQAAGGVTSQQRRALRPAAQSSVEHAANAVLHEDAMARLRPAARALQPVDSKGAAAPVHVLDHSTRHLHKCEV